MADSASASTAPANQNAPGGFKSVSSLQTAEDFDKLLAQQKRRRMRQEIDWRLNLAYYRGNQYVYWNPSAKRIESVPVEDGEKPRYRVRLVSNQIGPGSQSLISKIIKTKPIFGATPGQVGDNAIKAAEFAESLLEGWWRDLGLAAKYEEAVQWSIQAGNGYWLLDWDPLANKAMRFLLDPTGKPITDEKLEAEFRAQLDVRGIEPQERVVYLGDLSVEVMSPFHVWGDPSKKEAKDWKWCITQHNLDPDEVKARWKKSLVPNAVAANPDQTLPMGNAEDAGTMNVVKVYQFWHPPDATLPNGRHVVWSDSGGKQILKDEKWQRPELTKIPIVQFKGIKVPGMAEGDALTTHARPIQKQLNRILSQITEYFNLTIKPQWMAPYGSLRTRMTNEPGAVWEYNPVAAGSGGGLVPEPVAMQAIPPYVFTFLETIISQLQGVYGLTDVTEGTLPPNLEAADAIDLLQEMATDRFAPTIIANEVSLARAGQFLLVLAQKYYTEPRLLQIRGFGGAGSVKQFTRADFAGDITVHVEAGSSLPKTRAARRQQIEQWVSSGLLDPKKAWRYYDLADIKDIAVEFAMDEDHALREQELISQGQPINVESLQQAQQAIQQGMNPTTGQPLGPQDNPQQLLQRAGLQPHLYDNIEMHLDKHRKFLVSQEFEALPPQVQELHRTHYELTIEFYRSLPLIAQPEAPKVTVQLRESVGPSTMADILKRAGVPDADAHIIATEPPLDTMVEDDLSKPDLQALGPGPGGDELGQNAAAMLAIEESTAQQAADKAKLQQQLTQQQGQQVQQQQHTQEQHVLKLGQSDELHQQLLRKAKADADLSELKVKQAAAMKPPGEQIAYKDVAGTPAGDAMLRQADLPPEGSKPIPVAKPVPKAAPKK